MSATQAGNALASKNAGHRDLDNAVRADMGAERYRQKQLQARGGRSGVAGRPQPLKFDESGFPIPRRSSSLVQRVARLLNPL